MSSVDDLSSEEVKDSLAYAGLVLVAFELVKSMIVNPIKLFYRDMTFADGSLFKSDDVDVRSRERV